MAFVLLSTHVEVSSLISSFVVCDVTLCVQGPAWAADILHVIFTSDTFILLQFSS